MTPSPNAVRTALADGKAAGQARQPSSPNPYAPAHVAPWQWPSSEQARTQLERERRDQIFLAQVWQDGHSKGLADYAAQRTR